MSERATIIARWNHGQSKGQLCWFPFYEKEPAPLVERVQFVRNYMRKNGFVPLAWFPADESRVFYGSPDRMLTVAAAAGRLIEFIDGKYIARGLDSDAEMLALQTRPQHEPASCQEEKPAKSLGALLREKLAEVDANRDMLSRDIKKSRLPRAFKRTPFNNFDGFSVTSDCACESQPNTSFAGLTLDGCGAFVLPKQAF